ncbi:hypothetical protein D3C87_1875150 [compost metagenome]
MWLVSLGLQYPQLISESSSENPAGILRLGLSFALDLAAPYAGAQLLALSACAPANAAKSAVF